MSDLIDRISDHDAENEARIGRVAHANNIIFDSLMDALNEKVSRYNERHPQDPYQPNALTIHREPFQSNLSGFTIKKNTTPPSTLKAEFPINSGIMKFQLSSAKGKNRAEVKLDFKGDTPIFYANESLSTADFSDQLLMMVLSLPDERKPERKIGFI